jgi:hypothetical protein
MKYRSIRKLHTCGSGHWYLVEESTCKTDDMSELQQAFAGEL